MMATNKEAMPIDQRGEATRLASGLARRDVTMAYGQFVVGHRRRWRCAQPLRSSSLVTAVRRTRSLIVAHIVRSNARRVDVRPREAMAICARP
jgi:hypothetical protein